MNTTLRALHHALRTEGLLTVMVGTLLPECYPQAASLRGFVVRDIASLRTARDRCRPVARDIADARLARGLDEWNGASSAVEGLNAALLLATSRMESMSDVQEGLASIPKAFRLTLADCRIDSHAVAVALGRGLGEGIVAAQRERLDVRTDGPLILQRITGCMADQLRAAL